MKKKKEKFEDLSSLVRHTIEVAHFDEGGNFLGNASVDELILVRCLDHLWSLITQMLYGSYHVQLLQHKNLLIAYVEVRKREERYHP